MSQLGKPNAELNATLNARSNNSFNRSANSVAFMRETCIILAVRRARLIRALDTLRKNKRAEPCVAQARKTNTALNDTLKGRSNNSFDASGISEPVIEKLDAAR
jgi:hypothetical protein